MRKTHETHGWGERLDDKKEYAAIQDPTGHSATTDWPLYNKTGKIPVKRHVDHWNAG